MCDAFVPIDNTKRRYEEMDRMLTGLLTVVLTWPGNYFRERPVMITS